MKSATTYLQGLCELNLDHLAAAGILWPVGIVRYAGVRAFFGRDDAQTDPPGAWRALVRQVREHPGDVVLSNELLVALEGRKVGRLVAALAPAEVSVVVTARDPVRVIPSAWQTAIRNGEKTYSWREFASAVCSDGATGSEGADHSAAAAIHRQFWHHHDLAAVLRRWQEFVPPERVTLVTVPPSGGDPEEVARRFGTAIGVDLTGLPQPKSRGNATLGAYSTELVRRVNLAIPGSDRAARKYGIRNALADAALGAHARLEPEFGLPPDLHAWATQRARRMVEELRPIAVRVEGDLADLIPVAGPAPGLVDPGDTSDSQLLEVAVQGLIGTTRHAAKIRLKYNDLRAEIDTLPGKRGAAGERTDRRWATRAPALPRRARAKARAMARRILRT